MSLKYQLFLCLYFTIFVSTLSADRFYVNNSALPGGDGTSWETAVQFIHDALILTVSGRGDEVWIATGTYYPDEGNGITNNDTTDGTAFYLKNAVSVYGGFSGVETNIDERNLALNKTIISGSVVTNEDLTSISFDPNTSYNSSEVSFYKGLYSSVFCQFEGDYSLDGLVIKNFFAESPIIADTNLIPKLEQVSNCDFLYNYSLNNSLLGGYQYSGNSDTVIYRNCNFSFNGMGNESLFDSWAVTSTNCTFNNNSLGSVSSSVTNEFTNCVFNNNNIRDSLIGYSLITKTTNCIFYANYIRNGALFGSNKVIATNCTFSGNVSAGEDVVISQSPNFSLRNCIIDGNNIGTNGTLAGNFNNLFNTASGAAIAPDFPEMRATNLIFSKVEGYVTGTNDFGSGFLISTDPMFVDRSNVKGPDNIWGTADDGLRLRSTSPAIDVVGDNSLPFDTHDLDQDGDTTEALSLDITGNARKQGNAMDLGAYEFNSSEIGSYTLLSTAVTGGTVTPSGVSDHLENSSISITASPDEGYLFSTWSGDINTTENPTALVMDRNKSVVAVFIQDDNDDDGDGLSNYLEAVIYGSNPNQTDTSGDGFNDKTIVDAGFDPTQNYQDLITSLSYYSLDSLEDLRSGSVLINSGPNNSAKLHLQIERSEDLENWTIQSQDLIEIDIPVSSDTEFYRFAIPQD